MSLDLSERIKTGLQHHQSGRLTEAEAIYRSILDDEPRHPEILYLMSVLNLQAGNPASATRFIEDAISIKSDEPNYHNIAGEAQSMLGNLDAAVARYEQAIELNPGFAGAHNNLGNARKQAGKLEDAVGYYQRAVALEPGMVMAQSNLGSALLALGRTDEAIACLEQAVALDPNFPMAHFCLGIAHDEMGRPDLAADHYRRALAIHPAYAEAHNNLGNALDQLGERQAAIDHYVRAVEINPAYAEAHRNLARVDPARADERAVEGLLGSGSLDDADAVHCRFALGRIYSSSGDYDKAFENYRIGNSLQRKVVDYDAEIWTRYIDGLIEYFSEEYFTSIVPDGSDSELPVFILGVPRSGTTLVEQIVSSHPDVHGAGELKSIGRFEVELAGKLGAAYPECMHTCDAATIQEYAGRYLEEIRTLSPGAKRITDKRPANYLQIGLIKTLFPKARVIHCTRNRLDTCLSNYFNYFATGNPYSFDLDELGRYYVEYERLMAHWSKLFDSDIFDIRYEELISGQEHNSRRLIDYLGLEWDKRCLDFHQNRRPVHNLSSVQVRQPVYNSSINQWKNYEKHLGPLIQALDRCIA